VVEQVNLPGIPLLFLTVSDCPLTQYLNETRRLLAFKPEILDAIERDLDHHGLKKKAARLADQRWCKGQQFLPGQDASFEEAGGPEVPSMTLSQGRPRMSARTCYFFWMLCNHVGGIKSRGAADRIFDSKNVEAFLDHEGCQLPGCSSILENTNAISEETRTMILDAQIEMAREEGFDDFQRCQVDSTTVDANTAWPTDSLVMLKLVRRLKKRTKRLQRFGIKGLDSVDMTDWIAGLKSLDFQICNTANKKEEHRKNLYRKFLAIAVAIAHTYNDRIDLVGKQVYLTRVKPSQKSHLSHAYEEMCCDIEELFRVIDYCRLRIEEGISTPNHEKILSISDPDAAFLKKGSREPRIGYKPQLCRSQKGFVTALLVPRGNAADAPLLREVCDQSFQRTGIIPNEFSADGGYASNANRNWLLEKGVEKPSFSSSKGKAITPKHDWESQDYKNLRSWRSAVEALMSHIKGQFGFGKVIKRTLKKVQAELMDKVLTYNFVRLSCLRV